MKIGVLALQGAFIEHETVLKRLGVEAIEVRLPKDLDGVAGVIIPGGESTTIGKLAVQYNLIEPLRELAKAGKPLWGTCAGLIFMAKDVQRNQPLQFIGKMCSPLRQSAREGVVLKIQRMRQVVDAGQHRGAEDFSIVDHAADRHSAEADAVIALFAPY